MTDFDKINLGIALFGAITAVGSLVLGLVNTWWQFRTAKVRLKVIPKLSVELGGGMRKQTTKPIEDFERMHESSNLRRWCIEVVNLSAFPITISEIGFGNPRRGTRGVLLQPETANGRTLPVRLESREAVTVYAGIGVDLDFQHVKDGTAFVETDCGFLKLGTSPALKSAMQRAKKRRTCR